MTGDRIAWRRAARGLNLIGFGCFLLLTTQGVLPWSFWLDAARLWPLLLVALGLRMMLERVAPWAVLAAPLLVQGTLAWVALHPSPRHEPVVFAAEDWRDFEIERPEEAEAWILDAELALARLDVRGAGGDEPGALLVGRMAGPSRGTVFLARGGEEPRVRVRGHERESPLWRGPDESWELRVAEDLPLRADLELAFASGPVELSAVPLTRLDFEGAFNDVVFSLPAPEKEVRLRLQGAFNDLAIEVPAGTRVAVDVEGFLNGVHGRRSGGTGPGYRLELDGAFNSVELRER